MRLCRTTLWIPIGESPLNLALGMEAMIPLEIELPLTRVEQNEEPSNLDRQRVGLDLIEGTQRQA